MWKIKCVWCAGHNMGLGIMGSGLHPSAEPTPLEDQEVPPMEDIRHNQWSECRLFSPVHWWQTSVPVKTVSLFQTVEPSVNKFVEDLLEKMFIVRSKTKMLLILLYLCSVPRRIRYLAQCDLSSNTFDHWQCTHKSNSACDWVAVKNKVVKKSNHYH